MGMISFHMVKLVLMYPTVPMTTFPSIMFDYVVNASMMVPSQMISHKTHRFGTPQRDQFIYLFAQIRLMLDGDFN